MQPPTQELVVRDLHENTWTFRHIYRGKAALNIYLFFQILVSSLSTTCCHRIYVLLKFLIHHIAATTGFVLFIVAFSFIFHLYRAAKAAPSHNWVEFICWCKET